MSEREKLAEQLMDELHRAYLTGFDDGKGQPPDAEPEVLSSIFRGTAMHFTHALASANGGEPVAWRYRDTLTWGNKTSWFYCATKPSLKSYGRNVASHIPREVEPLYRAAPATDPAVS